MSRTKVKRPEPSGACRTFLAEIAQWGFAIFMGGLIVGVAWDYIVGKSSLSTAAFGAIAVVGGALAIYDSWLSSARVSLRETIAALGKFESWRFFIILFSAIVLAIGVSLLLGSSNYAIVAGGTIGLLWTLAAIVLPGWVTARRRWRESERW